MPRLPRRPLRDLRDVLGAGSLTLGIFGMPVALATMQPDLDHLATTIEAPAERAAVYVTSLSALDTAAATAEPVDEQPSLAEQVLAEEPPPSAEAPSTAVADAEPASPENTDPALEQGQALAVAEPSVSPPPPEPVEASPAAEPAAERTPPPLYARARSGQSTLSNRVALPVLARQVARTEHRQSSRERSTRQEAPSREARSAERRGRSCEDGTGSIADLGGDRYSVERSLIDLYVKDLELAQGLASVAWHRDERGKIDGFRIKRIRCGTVLHQAGFRNGDVVHSVNGKRIRTVFGAIGAYRKLKRKDDLRVDLTRRGGESHKLRFEVI